MKIRKKLSITNTITIVVSMILLTFVISMIVVNFINSDIEKKLIKENVSIQKVFSYNKFVYFENNELNIEKEFYSFFTNSSNITASCFLINGDSTKLLFEPYFDKNPLSGENTDQILSASLKSSYDINIAEKKYLAYNDKIDISHNNENYSLLITTLIPNYQIRSIIYQIIIVLIASIFAIGLLSILVTRILVMKITKPIKILEMITQKISNKNYDNIIELETGDEFEVLNRSVNEMAENIKNHEMETKRFYENISHELKTPLTVISGYAEGIKTNIFGDKEKAVDIIIKESAELKRQLDNIIYLSKLDTVKDYYKIEKTDLNELITAALKKVEDIIILNDIDVIYEPIDEVVLKLDKDKFIKMIINILSNCVKYTKDTIWIETQTDQKICTIKIYDNGIGFGKDILKDPFNRGITGDKDGSGIGLSIIKNIVDAHKGKIRISNNTNGGALYHIELNLP